MNYLAALLQFIAPPYCFYCRTFLLHDAVLCAPCLALIRPIVSASITVQNKTIPVYAVSAYKGPVKRLILAKGYKDILASYHIGTLIWERTNIANLDFDCIVPVPLHWTRRVVRGYNQADEIAQVLAQRSSKPVIAAIRRMRATRYQAELAADARSNNVRNVFAVRAQGRETIEDKHVLLVDDLMTTGSTLREVAHVLVLGGARKVSVVVAARVV